MFSRSIGRSADRPAAGAHVCLAARAGRRAASLKPSSTTPVGHVPRVDQPGRPAQLDERGGLEDGEHLERRLLGAARRWPATSSGASGAS